MAVPRGRETGAKYLFTFVEEMKASGFVAQSFARHRIEGASIAPPGAPP
jgi:polar amino acid transport system substrate-binding protein